MAEKKQEKARKKRSGSAAGSRLPRFAVWGIAGLAVIGLEVGVAYMAVTRFLMPAEEPAAGSGDTAAADSTAVSRPRKTPAPPLSRPAQTPAAESGYPESGMENMTLSPANYSNIQAMYTLADFVVNPAHSQGKHFFVSTLVFAFEDKRLLDLIKEREPILKDRIIAVLGTRTFEWFGDNDNRETVRREVLQIAYNVLGTTQGIHLYFTKYVLQ